MKKIIKTEYTENYGGVPAFMSKEFIDGNSVGDPHSAVIHYRETLGNYNDFVKAKLKAGYKIEITMHPNG
jgi:hypothetical protein